MTLKFRSDKMTEKIVKNNHVSLYTESFGNINNPALLFIAGAGAPLAFWTQEFIQQFVNAGYFVIRFDNRDSGLSSAVNYEKEPYTVMDLANDALAILNAYGIEKAHVAGHSMGGLIAQVIAINHPERILSMHSISVGTVGGIGAPPKEIMDVLLENKPTQNFEQSLPGFMKSWSILNGNFPLDEHMATEYTKDLYLRSHHLVDVAWSHIKAQEGFGNLSDQLKEISIPTFFIHGENDPLVPVHAGIATAQAVPKGKITVIPDMGHMIFNRSLEIMIAQKILANIKSIK